MRVIFVPVADRPECAAALKAAFTLGETLGASVVGCHIRPHGNSPVELPSMLNAFGITSHEAQWQAAWDPKDPKAAEDAASKLCSDARPFRF